MQSPGSEPRLDQAQQVCVSCKTRKRKCDKVLPKCSSCWRRNIECEYGRPQPAPSPGSTPDRWWHGPPNLDEHAGDPCIDYSTMLFLDPSLLQHGQVDISPAVSSVPAHILRLIGDQDEIRSTATGFFASIHLWMPVISKKRFHEIYLRSPLQARPDVALLLLSLKLITTLPPSSTRNPRTPLYYAAKHFYLEVECSSGLSVAVLQAGVLLSLYELGHAIYPGAFLSIGACARYAYALGINVSGNMATRRVTTLVEVEERRRIWWAIVILDRFVSIGSPGRPLATEDPKLEDLLPTNDAAWDEGIVRPDDASTLSSPMNSHMSSFALLCQASRLLGQVLHHRSKDLDSSDEVWVQLDRTLQSMLFASLGVEKQDDDQITFIYSTLVALYAPWLHTRRASTTDPGQSQRTKVFLQEITGRITANLLHRKCFLGRDPESMAPWGLFFAYHLCGVHMRSVRESSESAQIVEAMKEGLVLINARWNAAGVYLQLLEAQEAMDQT